MSHPVDREAAELAQVLLPALVALILGLSLPAAVRPLLMRWGVIDIPSQRSSHTEPTVRGMGLAMALATLFALAVSFAAGLIRVDRSIFLIAAAGMALAGLLGWAEDCRGIPVLRRAVLQLLIGLGITSAFTVAIGTSIWWIPVGTLAIAAYINVVNFMDGVNGISGLHGLAVGAAYAEDPLVWHGDFVRPTLEGLQQAMRTLDEAGSVGEHPLLYLHGEADRLVPLPASWEGLQTLRGPRTFVKTYPGAQHEIFNETNRDEVIGDVIGFVDGVLALPE